MATTKLKDASVDELLAELARRRNARLLTTMTEMEDQAEADAQLLAQVVVDELLRSRTDKEDGTAKRCPLCGVLCRVRRAACQRTVRTTTGSHVLVRNHHFCEVCKAGFFPLDIELGLPLEGELSSKLERQVLDLGVNCPFAEAAERWAIHHASTISENLVRRVVGRVGGVLVEVSPDVIASKLTAAETAPSTLIVEIDGSMLPMLKDWKEAKLAILYRDEHSAPIKTRGHLSRAHYVGTLDGLEVFRAKLTSALVAERAYEAERVAFLGDGAPWIWNLAEEVCPSAIQVLDWPHVVEHVVAAGKILFGEHDACVELWRNRATDLLWNGDVNTLLDELSTCAFMARAEKRDAVVGLRRYLTNNRERVRYADFREQGLPIGSGAIESAHRHVLQRRLKLAGQHWTPEKAEKLVQLRAAQATVGPGALHSVVVDIGNHAKEFKRYA